MLFRPGLTACLKECDQARDIAHFFLIYMFPHQGLLDNVISDRDPKFTSQFWAELMQLCRVTLRMTSSNHPQTDGASEATNRMVEYYIRCFRSFDQGNWDFFVSCDEFSYNSAVSRDLCLLDCEIDLGWKPRSPLDMRDTTPTQMETLSGLRQWLQSVLKSAQYPHEVSMSKPIAKTSGTSRSPPTVLAIVFEYHISCLKIRTVMHSSRQSSRQESMARFVFKI